ncbi:MAG: hypothetical protein ACLQQ4_17900 [Bacteroidia bacterium]
MTIILTPEETQCLIAICRKEIDKIVTNGDMEPQRKSVLINILNKLTPSKIIP